MQDFAPQKSKKAGKCLILGEIFPVEERKKKYVSRDAALLKLQRYCAYQDRCHLEARRKLLDLGIYGDDLENILTDLIADNFLNEERFARSFARGKFQQKGWGRQRITQELKQRQISAYCLRKALEEINEQDYQQCLREIIQRKNEQWGTLPPFERRGKIAQYAMSRGYETELIWEMVNQVVAD